MPPGDPSGDSPDDDLDLRALPLENLLASPLVAAAKAAAALAAAEAQFIQDVGFDGQGATRLVEFDFARPVEQAGENGTSVVTEQVRVSLPLLSLVCVPNLKIDTLRTQFTLEIQQVRHDPAAPGGGLEVLARPAAHREQTRGSDRTAKYTVELCAAAEPPTEALSRVFDLMAQAVVPITRPVEPG